MLLRVLLGLLLFLGSMGMGWWLRQRHLLSELRASEVVYWIIKVHSPIVLCLSFWKMNLRSAEPWLLPFLGTLISASTLLPAWLYARQARLSATQTGSFLNCAFFSNLGYLGAFTAFAVYGEAGYALCMLYLVFFTPCFYTLGFALAAHYGRSAPKTELDEVIQGRGEPRLNPFIGMALGVLLSLSAVPRPAWLEPCNEVLIPVGTALYLMAIGAQLTIHSPRHWMGACLAMSGIKFLYTPLVAFVLLSAFHLTGLPRIIVLLQASTPVAVSPLILPMLFGLDRKLANALWLFTTCLAIPWLLVLLPVLSRF